MAHVGKESGQAILKQTRGSSWQCRERSGGVAGKSCANQNERLFRKHPHHRGEHNKASSLPPPTKIRRATRGPSVKAKQVRENKKDKQRNLILTTPDKTKVRILFEPAPPLPPPNSVSRRTGFFFSEDSSHPRRATLFGGWRGEKRTLFCRGLNVSASLIVFFSSVLLSWFVSQVSTTADMKCTQDDTVLSETTSAPLQTTSLKWYSPRVCTLVGTPALCGPARI